MREVTCPTCKANIEVNDGKFAHVELAEHKAQVGLCTTQ
jgi:hypothetical protein